MSAGDNVCVPFFKPAQDVSGKATATIIGKTFVIPTTTEPTGGMAGTENINIVTAGAAAANVVGVATYDGANGDVIPLIMGPGHIIPMRSGAAVTAGDLIQSDSTGRAITRTSTNPILGVALETVAGADEDVAVRINF